MSVMPDMKGAIELKQPLQALLVAPDEKMRNDILSGIKEISIRDGWRKYRAGLPVMLCCHLVPWAVMAERIVKVRHCTLKEVTKEEYVADGFKSQKDLLAGLKRFYPNMTLKSPVTVIRWTGVKGYLVDNFDKELRMPKDLAQDLRVGR